MKVNIGILEYDCISYEEEFSTTEDGSLHILKIMLNGPITNNDDTLEKVIDIENELKKASYDIIVTNRNEEKIIHINNFYQIYYDDESFILFFYMTV